MSGPISNIPSIPQYSDFTSEWGDILSHLDTLMKEGKVFEATQYIATSMMLYLSYYTEDYQLEKQAGIQQFLSEFDDARSAIEQDFDKCQGGADSSAAQDALAQYWGTDGKGDKNGLFYLMKQGEDDGVFSSQFVSDVEGEFNTVFYYKGSSDPGENPPGSSAAGPIATQWNDDWKATSLSDNGSSNTDASLQAVTNALTAVSNDFSSQSSTAQSKLKYYESNDEQYKSMFHDIATEWINVIKQMVTATQSASS